jgi:hypothetical protein
MKEVDEMTKKEVLNDIMYDLKMSDSVSFEVDEESYTADKFTNGNGYVIESKDRYLECKNLTEVRKEISKLGKQLLWL